MADLQRLGKKMGMRKTESLSSVGSRAHDFPEVRAGFSPTEECSLVHVGTKKMGTKRKSNESEEVWNRKTRKIRRKMVLSEAGSVEEPTVCNMAPATLENTPTEALNKKIGKKKRGEILIEARSLVAGFRDVGELERKRRGQRKKLNSFPEIGPPAGLPLLRAMSLDTFGEIPRLGD